MTTSIEYQKKRSAMMSTYAPAETIFTTGKGCYLYTESNQAYLDFFSGIAVNCLGHCHPKLVATLQQQSEQLWHVSNALRVPKGEELAQKLAKLSGLDKVFFTNSGTESIECGLKMIRRYHFDNGNPQKTKIIGTNAAFHGRSFAAICAAGNPVHTKGFACENAGFDHVPYNDLAAIQEKISPETAGIIIEPLQGEGGIHLAQIDYIKGLRKICDENDILLMFDEVQCGVGRTGYFFAADYFQVKPDIMTLAKGIGGGFPVGACLGIDKVAKGMVVGTHGSTYGGNPLAMAVANTVIDIVSQESFLEKVRHNANILKNGLQKIQQQHPEIIADIRGLGLMIGLHCQPEHSNGDIVNCLREQHILVTKAGDNIIRLLPPLVIEQSHIDDALQKISAALAAYKAR